MKRFRFRLEPVLRQRYLIERIRQKEFALAQVALNQCDQEIARTLGLQDGAFRETAVPVEVLMSREGYFGMLSMRLAALQDRRVGLQDEWETARRGVVEARRNREALENLRESQLVQYRAETLRVEQSEIDESVTNSTTRNLAGLGPLSANAA